MKLPPSDLQRLLAEEPFVRALARSLVADEADDVVQQAWLRALEHRPHAVRDARSWLARLVHNLAVDVRRRRTRRAAREGAVAPHPLVPSSAELAVTEELRRELVAAVDALPEQLRTVVLLRWFEGLPPRRIAKDLGVPASVVSNRLHQALVALRQRMDAGHGGDRRAWLVPLVPVAASPRALPWQELSAAPATALPLTTGVIAMTSNLKVVGVAVLVAVVTLAWAMWPPRELPQAPHAGQAPAERVAASLGQPKVDEAPPPTGGNPRESVPAAVAATTGDLEVFVRYAAEPQVARDVLVVALVAGGDLRVDSRRAFTDGQGRVRFANLPPGTYRITASGRSGLAAKRDVEAGKVANCELLLQRGHRLDGLVVDGNGVPIGGAVIEMFGGGSDEEAQVVASAASDGTFVLQESRHFLLVGARARGFAASKLHFVRGDDAPSTHVRIELRAAGGEVEGVVVDPSGKPIADAVVRVGAGQTDGIRSTDQGAPPLPAQVRSDAEGRFLAIGVPAGPQPIMVRAAAMSPWRGSVEVMPGAPAAVRVMMTPGVVCSGSVRDEAGNAAAGAEVSVGKRGEFTRFETVCAADGTFVMRGLPAGDIEVAAMKYKVGKAILWVHGEPGTEVHCDFVLSGGLVLKGRVVDEAGQPLRAVQIRCEAESAGPGWMGEAFSDADGRFLITECPAGRTLSVQVVHADRVTWQRSGVDPRAGAHDVTLPKDTLPRARIVGRLLLPDGLGAIGTSVEANMHLLPHGKEAVIAEASGNFVIEVGPGRWGVRVLAKGFPQLRRDPRSLAAGEVWDVGTLQLVPGGTLVVPGEPPPKLNYLVFDDADRFLCGLFSPVPPQRSELIAPGDYRLFVSGKGIAAHMLPFTIRAGEETLLEVKPEAGVSVRFEFLPPTGETPRSLRYTLRRDGRPVAFCNAGGDASLVGEVWLAPGDYELSTRERPVVTTLAVSVRAGMTEPVRVVLR